MNSIFKQRARASLATFALILGLCGAGGCFLRPLPHSDYRSIHQACGNCDVETVAMILATNSAALNARNDAGRGPLHIASSRCCTNVIDFLVKRGANIELKGDAGETPLHVAAQEGCVDGVRMLVAKGADINARDKQRHTPLKRAIDYQQNQTAELLRKLGARY